ncbi:MAG: hypothetical protein ORN85_10445 [Sediminibacterium sp.]|nr:hypothetical protein [Sediminibacterium sp.]
MEGFKFRIKYDGSNEVFRDIIMHVDESFNDFAKHILLSFKFDLSKEIIFFKSNEYWQYGRMISEFDYGIESPVTFLPIKETRLRNVINQPHQKLIFQYDLLKKWTFYIELISFIPASEMASVQPFGRMVFSKGEAPQQFVHDDKSPDSLKDLLQKLNKPEKGLE